jgi:hypothetical protein
MMVDDVFVGIGSMNLNRRGFYHDGEMVASALSAKLTAARDNPARKLRVALWAEHLGIDPAMGDALLGDPMAAFELFRRSRYQGNRFTPFREFLVPRRDSSAEDARGVLGNRPSLFSSCWCRHFFRRIERALQRDSIPPPALILTPNPAEIDEMKQPPRSLRSLPPGAGQSVQAALPD